LLSVSRACFVVVMSLALTAQGQTQPPEHGGLANNPNFGHFGGAFRVGGGVSAPQATFSPNPEYSEAARQAKLEGSVVLWLIVGPDGRPRNIREAGTPLGLGLDESAIEAVKTWRFNPGYKDGKPVTVQINVTVDFRLDRPAGIKRDLDDEIAKYTKAIQLNPDDSGAYRDRGEAKYLKGDPEGAIADYTTAIELKADDSAAYRGRGEAKYSKSDLEGAIADYTKAIKLNPKFGAAYYGRCWARWAKGENDAADADDARAKKLGYELTCKD